MLSEILLDVACFLDYATLVVIRLSNKHLLCFAHKYADQLAFRRTFILSSSGPYPTQPYRFSVAEFRADNLYALRHTEDLEGIDDERIADAATKLQSHIGPHVVHYVHLSGLNFSLKPFVDLIPALRYASEIRLNYSDGAAPSSREYSEVTALFERPTFTEFTAIPIEALVVFLQSASASGLTGWAAHAPLAEKNIELDAATEDAVFTSCFDFANQEQGERRSISFVHWNLRWEFLRRLIEVLSPTPK